MNFPACLNHPWLHFIVIGALLFSVQKAVFPDPKPVIGPVSKTRIEALQKQWFANQGHLPAKDQLTGVIRAELDKDMLYQRALELELHLEDPVVYQRLLRNMRFLQLAEDGQQKTEQEVYKQALDMRLYLGDEVIKRRLIQLMEQLLLADNPPQPVTEDDIAASFAMRRQALGQPPRYSIKHLYFSSEREVDIESLVKTINTQGLSFEQAFYLSSPFLPGYHFVQQSPKQLARHLGSNFVINLERAGAVAGQWLGPIQSIYGTHYVWVSEIEDARPAELDEVRARLKADIKLLKISEALNAGIAALRKHYRTMP